MKTFSKRDKKVDHKVRDSEGDVLTLLGWEDIKPFSSDADFNCLYHHKNIDS